MSIIYKTAGRAKEYCNLAVNLYRGCSHGCIYCWGPQVLKINRAEFVNEPKPRENILERLAKECMGFPNFPEKKESVLLSFTSDPYQLLNDSLSLTRKAIKMLKNAGYSIMLLSKAGKKAEQDFDLLDAGDSVGATLTFIDEGDSLKWEPAASLPAERFAMLKNAKNKGIGTWVSLEPVIEPEQTLGIVELTHEFVDIYKVGTLNYHSGKNLINWREFALRIIEILNKYNCDYYIKNDLQKYLSTTAT
ncbi:MAG: hypothetical protein DDT41_01544 [candidate division WS2 bacterium]|nr:hypothetical protein [Candidatus Psychracetigena formicireducens]